MSKDLVVSLEIDTSRAVAAFARAAMHAGRYEATFRRLRWARKRRRSREVTRRKYRHR